MNDAGRGKISIFVIVNMFGVSVTTTTMLFLDVQNNCNPPDQTIDSCQIKNRNLTSWSSAVALLICYYSWK